MAVWHQSDLQALSRCAAEFGYKRKGVANSTNSAAAYGSVMHHCLEALEVNLHNGMAMQAAIKHATETFLFYWNPINIEAITSAVPADGWLPRQGYSELRTRGVETIAKYAELIKFDELERLATEFAFMVPIDGTWDEDLGEPHYLAGAIDLLAVAYFSRIATVNTRDWKTGKEYVTLRQNLQFSAYCYASTKLEFWTGHRGEDGFGEERGRELYERFLHAPRRGTWINLKSLKFQDAGWRGPHDYHRFAVAIEQLAALVREDIYPLTLTGAACTFCSARKVCAGVGVPDDKHGAPEGMR